MEVPEWNVRFVTGQPVHGGLAGVAFRAHYLDFHTPVNSSPIVYAGEMEEPFGWILLFRYQGQASDSTPIWWRLPKDKRPQAFPEQVGIAPINILLLYE